MLKFTIFLYKTKQKNKVYYCGQNISGVKVDCIVLEGWESRAGMSVINLIVA